MTVRLASFAATCAIATLALGATGTRNGDSPDDARTKAKRATSYVLLAEAIARVAIQVGGMTDREPYDKAIATYARSLGRLHAKFLAKLNPPEGAETLHKKVKEAGAEFARMAEAHYKADYATARKHREKCLKQFTQALLEVARMKRQGVIPSMSHGGGKRR